MIAPAKFERNARNPRKTRMDKGFRALRGRVVLRNERNEVRHFHYGHYALRVTRVMPQTRMNKGSYGDYGHYVARIATAMQSAGRPT